MQFNVDYYTETYLLIKRNIPGKWLAISYGSKFERIFQQVEYILVWHSIVYGSHYTFMISYDYSHVFYEYKHVLY